MKHIKKEKLVTNKRIIILLSVLIAFIICAVCIYIFTNLSKHDPTVELKGVLTDKNTGEKTPYSLEILKYDDITSDFVKNWILEKEEDGKKEEKPILYSLENDKSTSLDMYIFMPLAKDYIKDVSLSNIRIIESGTALLMYIDNKNIMQTKESRDLILRVYAENTVINANATFVRLHINGDIIENYGEYFY